VTGDDAADGQASVRPGDGGGLRTDQVRAGDDRTPLRSVLSHVATVAAGLLVYLALTAPNELYRLTPGAFVRIPIEALLGAALLLVLPARERRVVATLAGAVLGLLTLVKLLDIGFSSVLARPYDLVLDWGQFDRAVRVLTGSIGRAGAIGATLVAVLIAVVVPVLLAVSVRRLSAVAVRHRTTTARAVAGMTAVWLACAALGTQLVPRVPVASSDEAGLAYDHARQVWVSLQDKGKFAEEVAVDAYRDTRGEELLTALRGKDVVIAFVESYGRSAVEDPRYASQVGAVLDEGTRQLRAAGFASRSAYLTSSTAGGNSWLAHATLLSGLWVNHQQRYESLVAGDRLTLNNAFRRAGWRTVTAQPATSQPWPEGEFFGYDKVYDYRNLQYGGPNFSFGYMPDQYTLAAFERFERAKPKRPPVMAEIDLVSSHAPWTPLPRLVDWKEVGDGKIFGTAREGDSPGEVWKDSARVRTQYRQSIEYSLNTLISYVRTYGDDRLVLVLLGDHQPTPMITGPGANRDVPITIIAKDRTVTDRISGWGWHDGLKPGPQAPLWRMDAFRDRFLSTFGSSATPNPPPSAPTGRRPGAAP
jgi:hypothetical protein